MNKYIPGSGNPQAKLMIIGEAPGATEEQTGIPFTGPSGEVLFDILGEHGIQRSEVWVSNTYKYRPPSNNIKRVGEVCNVEESKQQLWNEIRAINPNCILCLGGTAFSEVRGHGGILKWRGSILPTRFGDKKLVGTIHPANLVRSSNDEFGTDYKVYPYIWREIFSSDVERAVEESKYPERNLEQKYVKICRSSVELGNFLERNKHNKRMSADVESINCVPVCISIAFNRFESLVIPLLNKMGDFTFGEIPNSDQCYIWKAVDELLKEKDIIGQNFKYDQDKLQMMGFSFKRFNPIYSDTLLKAHTLIPELPSKKMEMLQSLWTKMPYHKDEGKEFNLKKDSIDRLFHYGGLDALSTFETDENMEKDLIQASDFYQTNMVDFYHNYVMKLHEIYLDMENVGFNFDSNARAALRVKYANWHDSIQMRFDDLLPDFELKGKKCCPNHRVNVASPKQMKYLVYEHLGIPKRTRFGETKLDEDTIVAMLNNTVKDDTKRSILTDILEDRRVRKTIGTYITAKPDYDGRIRGSYRITGTETGRSSTAILKQPLRPNKSGHAFQTLTKHGDLGSDIRTVYIPDPGFVFIQADLSQAEPRIVAILSNDEILSAAFRSGKVDIHRRTAALVLDMMSELDLSEEFNPIADGLSKEGAERFLGKTCRNGGNYDMGKRELAKNIATEAKRQGKDITVSEWKAGKMLEAFHRASPSIREVFHQEIRDVVYHPDQRKRRVLINPYGRVRKFYERDGKDLHGEMYAHIPQSTVADHVKNSIILLKEGEMKDLPSMLLGEAHDALVFQFPVGEYRDRALLLKSVMEREIDFSQCSLKRGRLSIPVSIEIGERNYMDLEPLKL